jgi:hypothetical protein
MEELSLQRMQALARGNVIRMARAEDKRQIKAGRLNPTDILRHPPECWEKATVLELVMSMHRVGKSRARKWLTAERIDPGREIGRMTELQRFRLAKHLDAAVRRAAAVGAPGPA